MWKFLKKLLGWVDVPSLRIAENASKSLNDPSGFTLGMKVEPGIVSKEFQDKLDVIGFTTTSRHGMNELKICCPKCGTSLKVTSRKNWRGGAK